MKLEIYKSVVGYDGLYEVSNMGAVRSLPRNTTKGKVLKFKIDRKTGYKMVTLCKNGVTKCKTIHSMVVEAFICERKEGYDVDHIDRNKLNNDVDNLRYVPHSYNCGNRVGKYVGFNIARGKWYARIQVGGKTLIKEFESESQAKEYLPILLTEREKMINEATERTWK